MNAIIMMIQIFHKMKYDLTFYDKDLLAKFFLAHLFMNKR